MVFFRSIGSWATRQISEVRRQAPAARMIGEFVVRQGVREVEKRMQSKSATASASDTATDATMRDGADSRQSVEGSELGLLKGGSVSADEPFSGYDNYTSRQVLDRIASMDGEARRRVWEYENAHRRRETILAALTPGVESAIAPSSAQCHS